MFLAVAALALIVAVPLFGGDLRRLAGLHLRGLPLLYAMLVLQVLLTDGPRFVPATTSSVLHVASYAGIGAFAWLNRALPGVAVLAAGGLLNGLVIALNGGTLPATTAALRTAGLPVRTSGFANSAHLAHPRLAFLGDTMATPSWLPFRNVISVGDLVILLGAAILLHVTCATWPARAMRAGTSAVGVERDVAGHDPVEDAERLAQSGLRDDGEDLGLAPRVRDGAPVVVGGH
jgi:hypothetical protein